MKRPLKICHVSTVHPLHDPRIFYLEAWSQAQAGHDVHYLVQADREETLNGVRIHSLGRETAITGGLRVKQRLQRLWRAARLAPQIDADIYHVHDPELIPVAIWLRLRTGRIVIFDAHEDDVAYVRQKFYLPRLVRPLLVALMALNVRLAARFLDAVVVCDQGVADLYRRRYGARRVEIAHNFPRQDVFLADEPAESNGEVAGRPYDLVYHGSIPPYHLEVAFNVAEELRKRGVEARWLFFGDCPRAEWAYRELEKRGLRENFTIQHGWIHYDEVVPRVRQARLGFIPLPDLPKFQNNIPSKLFEFMALGMPTVLSDLPPSRPFVGDGQCAIMVPPADYAAYAEAIQRLLTDRELYRRMGEVGRQRIREKYNWEQESARILALYERLAQERGRA